MFVTDRYLASRNRAGDFEGVDWLSNHEKDAAYTSQKPKLDR